MRKKVYIHLGYQKTGTTLLQKVFNSIAMELLDSRVLFITPSNQKEFCNHRYNVGSLMGLFWELFLPFPSGVEDILRQKMVGLFAPVRAEKIVLSSENFTNVFMCSNSIEAAYKLQSYYKKFSGGAWNAFPFCRDWIGAKEDITSKMLENHKSYYSSSVVGRDQWVLERAEALANSLKKVWKDFDVHIVFTLRRQDLFLESLYNQKVKGSLECRDFEHFVDDFSMMSLDYTKITNVFRQHFGQDNIHVLFFEQVKSQSMLTYVNEFLHFFLPQAKINNFDMSAINPSLSKFGTELMRIANQQLETVEDAEILRFAIAKVFPKDVDEKHNIMSENLRQVILSRFAESNNELFKREKSKKNYLPYYLGVDELLVS